MIKKKLNEYKVFNIPIISISTRELTEYLIEKIYDNKQVLLAFANANTLNLAYKNNHFSDALKSFVIVNDGIGVEIAVKILYKKTFLENLNGTDFMPFLFSALPSNTKLYFLGSTEENIRTVERKFKTDFPGLDLVGVNNGYFRSTNDIVEKINILEPHVVVVGCGNPKQEIWIEQNHQSIKASIFIGVGAFFDFYSGEVARAPLFIRKVRFEWLFRLLLEPRRLWKRYIVGNFIFLVRVLIQKYF